jgi:excisionase family DNA binding protein
MQADTAQPNTSKFIDDELLTVDELKTLLKLPSRNWIYQRIHSRTLPFAFIKIGHYTRFRLSDVQRWIASQTTPGSAA